MKSQRLAFLVAAALCAAPAFAQTSSSMSSPNDATSAAGTSTSTPGTLGTSGSTTSATDALDSSSKASSVNDPSRYDTSSTHLNADCYDRVTGITRTTGDCATTAGTGLSAPGASSGTSSGMDTSGSTSSGMGTSGSTSSGTAGATGTGGSSSR